MSLTCLNPVQNAVAEKTVMINLIGLHGKKRSGKDTVYGILNDYLEFSVRRDGFADRLKLSALRIFNPDIDLETAVKMAEFIKNDHAELTLRWREPRWRNEHGQSDTSYYEFVSKITGREFLQNYGTEAHRDVFDQDFWISAVLPDRSDRLNFGRKDDEPWSLLVITDVRFPTEAEAIREAGGVIWHVVRPDLDDGDTHASEIPLPPELIDFTINNDGTLEDLEETVRKAWNLLPVLKEL